MSGGISDAERAKLRPALMEVQRLSSVALALLTHPFSYSLGELEDALEEAEAKIREVRQRLSGEG